MAAVTGKMKPRKKQGCNFIAFLFLPLVLLLFSTSLPLAFGLGVKPYPPEQFKIVREDVLMAKEIIYDTSIGNGQDLKEIFKITDALTNYILVKFSQVYHYSFPAVPFWKEARQLQSNHYFLTRRIYEAKDDYKKLEEFYDRCDSTAMAWEKINDTIAQKGTVPKATIQDNNRKMKICLADHETITESARVLKDRIITSFRDCLHVVADSLYYSVNRLEYNGFPTQRSHWTHFDYMLDEVTAFNREIHARVDKGGFENYIAKVRDSGRTEEANELEKRLMEIKNTLNSDPYKSMYFNGDIDKSNNFWNGSDSGLTNFRENINELITSDQVFDDQVPYRSKNGTKRWSSKDGLVQFVNEFKSRKINLFYSTLLQIYIFLVDVKVIPEKQRSANFLRKDKDGNDVVVGDGMFYWDLNNGIHNMRLAWELMGRLLEEIKCYMKDTYYFDLRNEALQATQLNLTEGALFSGVSQTLFFPCRIENETDLVSPYCNAKNHEICAPMTPLESFQRTDSESHGGKSLLKPKWVYQYNEKAKRCWGRRDYVMKYYACRCGFRLDCGQDLGVNISCQLTHNDLLRRQCRGNVGYPCKTLPLAPGKHHESCASGYCDLEENSCEDRPLILSLQKKSGGHSILKGKSMSRLLVCLGGLIVVGTAQWIMQAVNPPGVRVHVPMDSSDTRRSGRSFNPRRRKSSFLVLATVMVLLFLQFGFASSLQDDWYGFTSFRNAYEFETAYADTCSYSSYDLFREPEEFRRRDNLRARSELLAPIRISSKETVNSTEFFSLHIYNYPAIRRGYSVSYGFQRNKECLHSQDVDCVAYPELGRVRALVLNAERFNSKEQNLNKLKDHFLIERPEHFVSILNGGSPLERKFYEAVFLGGYTDDPRRTSHQIDGKKYPLEIYMYFLDETVPSVSLATILVVLVEESPRDNPHIKPIINAVENTLYDKERRFLEANKALVRRQRVFHHLEASTYYDPYRPIQENNLDESVVPNFIESSVISESIFAKHMEAFEKLQAVEAELFFLLEDFEHVSAEFEKVRDIQDDIFEANDNLREFYPIKLLEYQMLLSVFNQTLEDTCKPSDEGCCQDISIGESVKYFTKNPLESGHDVEIAILAQEVCKHFDEKLVDIRNRNLINVKEMRNITRVEKYQLIRDFCQERIDRKKINEDIYRHFHGDDTNPSKWHDDWTTNAHLSNVYGDDKQKYNIANAMLRISGLLYESEIYKKVEKELRDDIENILEDVGYNSLEDLQRAIIFLKYGGSQNETKYPRRKIHKKIEKNELPEHEKKLALVELGGMEMLQEELDKQERKFKSPIKATVEETFQISWLIPQDGGYFYYEGSSPIPPCSRADNVIVFKRPISMSKRQIEILTRIPLSFDRERDIRLTAPIVHDTAFEVELSGPNTEKSRIAEVNAPVYNHRKNHLFLGHDGVRKNSVEESERLKAAKGTASVQVKHGKIMAAIIIMSIVYAIIIW